MKKIYIDIDGVILTKDHRPAKGLLTFLKFMTENHDCYWLTTHCKGDNNSVIEYLSRILPQDYMFYIKKIKPTNWGTLKTDAIDLGSNFIWFDDYVMQAELNILKKHHCLGNLIKVDLKKNPNQLLISGMINI